MFDGPFSILLLAHSTITNPSIPNRWGCGHEFFSSIQLC